MANFITWMALAPTPRGRLGSFRFAMTILLQMHDTTIPMIFRIGV